MTRMAAGGLVIEGGGSLLGAIAVSSEPVGDMDGAFAHTGIHAIADALPAVPDLTFETTHHHGQFH